MRRQNWNSNWIFSADGREGTVAVTLPHDAMQTETRTEESPGGSAVGYYLPNTYTYEKTFSAPFDWEEKSISLQFEGVYRNSKVYVNNAEAGGVPYGYIPFFVQLDGLLKYGCENTVRVVADNSEMPNSRWYSGSPKWIRKRLTGSCLRRLIRSEFNENCENGET